MSARGTLELGRMPSPDRSLSPSRMAGVGELHQLNGSAVFDEEGDAHAGGRAVGRNQNFAAGQLGRKVIHFTSDMGHLALPLTAFHWTYT